MVVVTVGDEIKISFGVVFTVLLTEEKGIWLGVSLLVILLLGQGNDFILGTKL